jgi:rhodanese-related sulfurtransferase
VKRTAHALAKLLLLDVREAKELTDAGKIEGAVNIPIGTLTKSLDKLPHDKAAGTKRVRPCRPCAF